MNHRGFSIYTVISIIALAALVFVLVLPNYFNFEERERTAKCIENMKLIKRGMSEYMQRKDKEYSGDVTKYMHLVDGKYVIDNIDVSDLKQDALVDAKVDAYCPESKGTDKYIIVGTWKDNGPAPKNVKPADPNTPAPSNKTPVVTVKCPLEKEHPKHVLPADFQ
jgi:hypothetical protein